MIELLASMTYWHWLILGLTLIAAEIIAPGIFLLWPGLAAVIVGLLNALVPGLDWTVSVSLWAVLSIVTVVGFLIYRKSHPSAAPSLLNRRGEQYVGRRFTLEKPVINGKGEVRADDTIWKVVSVQDLAAGTTVVVTAVEGTFLRVIAAENA